MFEYLVAFGALWAAGVANEKAQTQPPPDIMKKAPTRTPRDTGYWRDDRIDGPHVLNEWVVGDESTMRKYGFKLTTDLCHQPYMLQQDQRFSPQYYDWKLVGLTSGVDGEDRFTKLAFSKRLQPYRR